MYKDHRKKVQEKHNAHKESMQLEYYVSLREQAKQLKRELAEVRQYMHSSG